MSSAPPTAAVRRQALVARCDQERDELIGIAGEIANKLSLADSLVVAARRLHRHRGLVGAAGAFLIFGPQGARNWLRGAISLVPMALAGYRRVDSRRKRP